MHCIRLTVLCFCFVVVIAEYPIGHLLPFGHHRPPSVPIVEFTRENAPRPEEFYTNYVKKSKPVIFRDAIVDSKAFRQWSDQYIKDNFGEMEVRLEGKREKKHMPPVGEKYLGRDNLRHFVDTYHQSGNNVYIVSDLPSTMYRDMGVVPSFGACGEMSRRIVEVDIWWSGGGSSSIIHKDAFNQMNCLLNGTKYWKLIEYKYEKDIYKHPEPDYELGGFSDVNPERVNLVKQPKVKDVEWSNITVHAGDCLFLPKSYYHQVTSAGTNNKAVSILFSRFDNRDSLDFSDCTEAIDYKSVRSLDEFGVHWPWKGKGVMVMGRADLEEGVRGTLLSYIAKAESQNRKFDSDYCQYMLDDMDYLDDVRLDTEEFIKEADLDRNGFLSEDEVKEMSIDVLRQFADKIEKYEPSNSYEFEYSVIPFEAVWALLKLCMKEYETLTENEWLRHYKDVGGTDTVGKEIFHEISGDKTQIISSGISEKILYEALQKWVKYFAPQYSRLEEPPTDLGEKRSWYGEGLKWLKEEGSTILQNKMPRSLKKAHREEL